MTLPVTGYPLWDLASSALAARRRLPAMPFRSWRDGLAGAGPLLLPDAADALASRPDDAREPEHAQADDGDALVVHVVVARVLRRVPGPVDAEADPEAHEAADKAADEVEDVQNDADRPVRVDPRAEDASVAEAGEDDDAEDHRAADQEVAKRLVAIVLVHPAGPAEEHADRNEENQRAATTVHEVARLACPVRCLGVVLVGVLLFAGAIILVVGVLVRHVFYVRNGSWSEVDPGEHARANKP